MYKFSTFLAVIWTTIVLTVIVKSQTQVSPAQIKPTIAVVEWQNCQWQSTTACVADVNASCPCVKYPNGCNVSCIGLELFRFRMSDGSLKGPYFAVPVPSTTTIDPTKWVPQPLQ